MRRALLVVAAACLVVAPSLAIPAPTRETLANPTLPDFDIRTTALSARSIVTTAAAPAGGEKAARKLAIAGALAAEAGGLDIRWSTLTGGPRTIVPRTGAITAPRAGTPSEIARAFIRENAELYGIAESDLDGLRLVREYATRDTGVTHLTFVQEADGRRVIGADLRVAVDPHGRVVWAGGELVPNASLASKRNSWALDASSAAEAAARTIGAAAEPRLVAGKTGTFGETLVELGDAFTEPAAARQTLFPIASGSLRPSWTVLLAERGPGNLYVVTVDAEKGTLLARHNLTRYASDPNRAQFRVFTKDSPQPNLPFVSGSPNEVGRELITLTPAILDASPQGWFGTSPVTSGNNVRAQEDRAATNSGGRFATGTAEFVFDPALDFPIKTNLENTDAAIVNLFYWCNFIHDYLYRLGFDEAAGNFQVTNFTGEGRGNDPIIADAQDGGGINNANFATPPDGSAPRMQMFLWRGGYDGSFDQTVIVHEYVHGLSTRLVGGADYVDGLTGPQSGGMGEGWSDWYALTMLTDPTASLDADYAVGGYLTRDFTAGVRNFPYTTNMSRNPITYADIDPATSNVFGDPTEVHNVGEVWCAALWEVRANFIRAYGPVEGKRLVEQLVTDGMKFSANNPSFVDARDGILVADQVRTNGANQCLIWEGFAKRGVGFGASTLNGSAVTVKEAFDVAPWCTSAGRVSFDRLSYDEADTRAVLRVASGNLAGQTSVAASVSTSSGDAEAITLAAVANIPGLFEVSVPVRRATSAASNGTLEVAVGDTITLSFGGQTATARFVRRVSLFADAMESGSANWKAKKWTLTSEAFASPSTSWTDSPGRNYADESVYRLQTRQKLDLRNAIGTRLVFKHKYDTEPGYDLCIVEARAKGTKWVTVAVFSGLQRTFEQATVDLSEFDGKTGVRVRFSLV